MGCVKFGTRCVGLVYWPLQTVRLMCLTGVKSAIRERNPLTIRFAKIIDNRPDLVNRNFSAAEPNQLWVADIT